MSSELEKPEWKGTWPDWPDLQPPFVFPPGYERRPMPPPTPLPYRVVDAEEEK